MPSVRLPSSSVTMVTVLCSCNIGAKVSDAAAECYCSLLFIVEIFMAILPGMPARFEGRWGEKMWRGQEGTFRGVTLSKE